MHVAKVPNRTSRPAYLLRESYRDGDKVKTILAKPTPVQKRAFELLDIKLNA